MHLEMEAMCGRCKLLHPMFLYIYVTYTSKREIVFVHVSN